MADQSVEERGSEVRRAFRDGVSVGLRDHVPGAVGILAKGIPICLLAAFAHFVLGVSVPGTLLGAGLTGAGYQALGAVRRERESRSFIPRIRPKGTRAGGQATQESSVNSSG